MPLETAVTTAGVTLNKVWRKEQGNLMKGFKSITEEYRLVKGLQDYKLNVSAREITAPVNIHRQGGTAMIPEGGWEAQASTRPVEEVTLTWVNANQRFTVTLTARQLDKRNRASQVERQVKYQAMKAMEAVSRRVGETFYGYSSGVVCRTSTVGTNTTQTLALTQAFGDTGITNAPYCARMFAVEDRVALVRAGALVANAIGVVTAVDETVGTITVAWSGSVTSANGDNIVFANSIENATLDAGTDWNKWPIGLLDASKSASVHGLSSASVAGWAPALQNTSGGRFSGVKLRQARYAIGNKGGGTANTIIWSQGVETDVFENNTTYRRFINESALNMDGVVKTKEKQFTSVKVPPGHVFMYSSDAYQKFTLEPLPDENGQVIPWEDGDKIQGRNAWAFAINVSYAFVVTNRAGIAYFSGLTEQ